MNRVVALWRYPVKSMMGEELNFSQVSERGLLGDRAYALVDATDGKVGSAKNPRKWPHLFQFRAAYVEGPQSSSLSPVRITFPDGSQFTSADTGLEAALSRVIGRDMRLAGTAPEKPQLEEYWPAIEGLAHQDEVTDEAMPVGTFFDCATVHLLTTQTLDRLRELYSQGRFEVRRFRPNIVVRADDGASGFVENAWVGRTIAIGDQLRLKVQGPCPRCVMTTLEQGDLPADPGILKTAVKHNGAGVGVYASVLQGGAVKRGDEVRVE